MTTISPDIRRKTLIALKLAVRDAWRVLSLIPDPDARFRAALGGGWCFPVVHDARDAYGASPATSRARPTPQEITRMEEIMWWMAWLRRLGPQLGGGDFAVKRIMGWSLGAPIWALAQRERCSERTVERRIGRSLEAVLGEFAAGEVVDDDLPPRTTGGIRAFTESPLSGEAGDLEPGKVYIDGIGLMFRGKRYDDGGKLLERKGKNKFVA